jgi:hypothetical protein
VSVILLLTDGKRRQTCCAIRLNLRARKAKELMFYQERKRELEEKLFSLRAEIRLTDDILAMIRKESP